MIAHQDETYPNSNGKKTSMSKFHLYLNDKDHQEDSQTRRGGVTTFRHASLEAKKRGEVSSTGIMFIFQHRNLYHSGDDVISGPKHTMRTDVMYERETQESQSRRIPA